MSPLNDCFELETLSPSPWSSMLSSQALAAGNLRIARPSARMPTHSIWGHMLWKVGAAPPLRTRRIRPRPSTRRPQDRRPQDRRPHERTRARRGSFDAGQTAKREKYPLGEVGCWLVLAARHRARGHHRSHRCDHVSSWSCFGRVGESNRISSQILIGDTFPHARLPDRRIGGRSPRVLRATGRAAATASATCRSTNACHAFVATGKGRSGEKNYSPFQRGIVERREVGGKQLFLLALLRSGRNLIGYIDEIRKHSSPRSQAIRPRWDGLKQTTYYPAGEAVESARCEFDDPGQPSLMPAKLDEQNYFQRFR